MKKKVSEKISRISESVLTMAGVSSVPGPNNRPAGVSRTGRAVFVSNNIANSDDIQAGAAFLHILTMFVAPFNVLSKKDKESIDRGTKIASNPRLIRALDIENANRNAGKFGATLIKAVGSVTSHALAATTAFKLYDHWGVMSPAQKSIAIGAMGVQLYKTDEGGAVCDSVIVKGKNQLFKVSDALKMVQNGKNPYPLVLNWSQIYRLAKVYIDNPNLESLMDFAISHGFLGQGINDAAVPGVSKVAIEKSGATAAPQYGVGALIAPIEALAPEGYADAVQLESSKIIVPQANANTAAGALIGSLIGTKAGINGISTDSIATYSKWNKNDKKAIDKGSEGGSTLIGALTRLKKTNKFMYSAMIAFLARYTHEDIDGVNASHYVASLAGISLARIVSGKAEKAADSDGANLARRVNASNPADFAKLQVLMRSLYANFGVNSKSDAYQLSNQAYSEERIDECDLVAMQQVFDIIYDVDSFGQIEGLLEGRQKGLQIIKTEAPDASNTMVEGREQLAKETIKEMSLDEIKARNRQRYTPPKSQQQQAAPPEEGAMPPEQEEAELPPEQMVPGREGTPPQMEQSPEPQMGAM